MCLSFARHNSEANSSKLLSRFDNLASPGQTARAYRKTLRGAGFIGKAREGE